jgi:quinol monooxygenase YgiN
MIIVTGAILARPETFEKLRALSLEHVARSREEPGCLEHGASMDAENPLRIRFFERWIDATALKAHFAVPATRTFSKEAGTLAAEAPSLALYAADEKAVTEMFARVG